MNDKKSSTYNLNTTEPIMTNFLKGTRDSHQTTPRWRMAAIMNYVKCDYFYTENNEDVCTKFGTEMQHDHGEMPTWPTTEPEVISHDGSSRTSRINVGHSRRLYDIFDPHLANSSRNRQPSWRNVQNSLIVEIQGAGDRHIDFWKMSISLGQQLQDGFQLICRRER